MTYLVLARKYRPQTLKEVLGQTHITKSLGNAILNDRVAHFILFSGSKGTGKTSIARILAKTINCSSELRNRPCNSCRSCTDISSCKGADVFEIDGASNNSVEQIRNLQENIPYMPNMSPMKIYIIDEAHMLSSAAFNALLKTLEEPPPHVMFILATTKFRKIPPTIASRCQHHNLRRIKTKIIQNRLFEICSIESFKITSESLWTISVQSNGSMRDALSLLDQIISCCDSGVPHNQIIDILSIPDRNLIHKIAKAILLKNSTSFFKTISFIYANGYDLKLFYNEVVEYFIHLSILRIDNRNEKLIDLPSHEIKIMQTNIDGIDIIEINQILALLSREEIHIKNADHTKLAFEIVFLKIYGMQSTLSIDLLVKKLDFLKKKILEKNLVLQNNSRTIHQEKNINLNTTSGKRKKSSYTGKTIPIADKQKNINLNEVWQQVIDDISKSRPSLSINLSYCSFQKITNQHFEIEIKKNEYTFKALEKNLKLIKQTVERYYGNKILITLQNMVEARDGIIEKSVIDKKYSQIIHHPLIADAVEIFNGKVEEMKFNTNGKE